MMQIFKYPYETLTEKSSDWLKEDSINGYDDIELFENDMCNLMQKHNGIGLAANQIGITKNFFAIGSDTFDTFVKPAIIWNPRVIKFSKNKVKRIIFER